MKRMVRLFMKSKNKKADEDEDKHEGNDGTSQTATKSVHRIVKAFAGARSSPVKNSKQRKSSVNSADLPRDPCPSQEPDVNLVEKNVGASQREERNNCHSLATIVPPHDAVASLQNTASISSSTCEVSALKDMKRMLDPNTLARMAAPQPLNNFMHRLPTIERLEAEGLYTLVDPTIQLISEVTEEVGDQLTQLLSPRKGHEPSNTIPRLTNGCDSGRAVVPQLTYYDSQAATHHSTQAVAVSQRKKMVSHTDTEAFV
jgi:hypothetical protein